MVCALVLLTCIGLWRYRVTRVLTANEHPTFRLGTWNLRYFGDNETDEAIADVADLIRQQSLDLVAVQELRGNGNAADRLAGELGGRWTADVSEQTGNYERFAFVYNRRVVRRLGSVKLYELSSIDRQPHAARFQAGNFDFTLINVHLLASDTDRRRQEAIELANILRQDRWPRGERDVIVLGDFNTRRPRGPTLSAFASAGFDAATQFDALDYILLRRSDRLQNTDIAPAGDLSDHDLVWSAFDTTSPDDD